MGSCPDTDIDPKILLRLSDICRIVPMTSCGESKVYWLKTCPREHRAVVLHAISHANETLPVLRVYPKTQKDKLVSVLVFSGGR